MPCCWWPWKIPSRRPTEGFWRALMGSWGKALEPKPFKDTSPDEPRLGSCKAY